MKDVGIRSRRTIAQPGTARVAFLPAIAFTLFACLILLAISACSSQPVPLKATPTAAAPGLFTLGVNIVADGRVTPVRGAALSFGIGGIVTKLPVALGERVEAGAVLAQIDDSIAQKQISQAQMQVEIAKKQQGQSAAQTQLAQKQLALIKAGATDSVVASAKAALNAANANYAKVKGGPTPDELAQLKAALDNAKAALDQAQSAYDRAGGASNPFIGQTPEALKLQQSTNTYAAALAAFNDARSHPTSAEMSSAFALVQQAQSALASLTPTGSALDVAQAQVDSAIAAEALALAQVNSAQAAVETAEAQAANYTLHAPFGGTVTKLDMSVGEYASPGAVVVEFADISAWQIETTDLTELNIANIAEGTPATMTFDAVPGLELPGKVTAITPFGESKQGDIDYTVIITPDQHDDRLRWNMTSKVSIVSKQ